MKEQFEAQDLLDGRILLMFGNGKILCWDLSTPEGIDFADEYIDDLRSIVPYHLDAIEMLLKQDLGEYKYNRMLLNEMYHKELLVKQSIRCCFGKLDNTPDRDFTGKYNFEFVACPRRDTCPFNGYNPKNKDNKYVICNPIINTGLSSKEAEVTQFLIQTELTNTQIAAVLHISMNTLKRHICHIFAKIKINSRAELTNKLLNQRLR